MPRRRDLPDVDELHRELAELGVTDAPRDAPDEEALKGLLDLAAWVATHRKRVAFPDFSWDDPAFIAEDARVRMRIPYAAMEGSDAAALARTLDAHLPRVAHETALLAVDAHATEAREYELMHHLYGEVTLFAFPHRPVEPADPRVHEAAERGWTKTLKQHNLLPGRGIVVLDEHQGALLRDPRLQDLRGVLLLLPDGHTEIHWNPFARADRNDPEMQHWLSWGAGTGGASEWREVLHVDADDVAR